MKYLDTESLFCKLEELGISFKDDNGGTLKPNSDFTGMQDVNKTIKVGYINYIHPVIFMEPGQYMHAITHTFEQFDLNLYDDC